MRTCKACKATIHQNRITDHWEDNSETCSAFCPAANGAPHEPTAEGHVEEADRPFVVCPTCKGHGHHGPGHVFTQDDLDEQFGPDQYDVMQDYRDGKYDVTCTECKGARVVKDECPCPDCEEDREYEREAAVEAAYFARMGM